MPAPVFRLILTSLFSDAKPFDQSTISFDINLLEVLKQLAAFTDQTQQCALGAEVVLVCLEVIRKVVDTVRKQRDLTLGRAGIGVRLAVLAKKLLLFFSC